MVGGFAASIQPSQSVFPEPHQPLLKGDERGAGVVVNAQAPHEGHLKQRPQGRFEFVVLDPEMPEVLPQEDAVQDHPLPHEPLDFGLQLRPIRSRSEARLHARGETEHGCFQLTTLHAAKVEVVDRLTAQSLIGDCRA